MKKYIPEQLAAISRYQNYIPTLPPVIQQELYARIGELCDFRFVRHETDAGEGWERSESI